MSVPYQKTIKIYKEKVKDWNNDGRFYLCCYQDNLQEAMQNLSHSGFKVYLALLFNKNYYKIDYSPQYISNITGMCLDTARKGLKELILKRYLVAKNEKETIFSFYENKKLSNLDNQIEEQELEKMTAIIQNTIKGKNKKEQLEIINKLDLNINLNN